jgi:translation initiation factor IF-3
VQLSPRIDPHDLGIKTMHAIDFLCEDMKVKVALKFRGRENAHTEIGFEVIHKFIENISPYGHPDFQPKLVGKAINLMISPLPRNKRAKHPRAEEMEQEKAAEASKPAQPVPAPAKPKAPVSEQPATHGLNDPFANLDIK